ncbi:unnamed protein product [Symbiodinium sp. KB8]|nr:unnamed protein product [Symbiodinium sp. KB8]
MSWRASCGLFWPLPIAAAPPSEALESCRISSHSTRRCTSMRSGVGSILRSSGNLSSIGPESG